MCWNELRDPVCLPCEHYYCRGCITQHLDVHNGNSRCPQCRSSFTRDDVRVNRALRNIVDAAKQHLREHRALREQANVQTEARRISFQEHCNYHGERLKLFCVTDQKLVCVICKEEQRHRGHAFKTIEEAFSSKKEKTTEVLEMLVNEEQQLVDLYQRQAQEILNTREKSRAISEQISSKFESLHQFLRDKEDEVKKQLDEQEDQILDIMGINIFTMEELLTDVRGKQGILMSALESNSPCQFLQWWNENGRSAIRDAQHLGTVRPAPHDVCITPDSLFLGPYETHLQHFVWKEMLAIIYPVPHHHPIMNGSDNTVKVSPNGLCLQPRRVPLMRNQLGAVWLKTEMLFTTGQHYWELDVGEKKDWGVGVCSCNHNKRVNDTVFCHSPDSGYLIQQSHNADSRTVQITSPFRKIGVYLDCERQQVSFYNADSMILIDTRVLSKPKPHCLCLSPGLYMNGNNSDPLILCWY